MLQNLRPLIRPLAAIVALLGFLLAGLSLLSPNAGAAVRPTVTLNVPAKVAVGTTVKIRGKVSNNSVGATVVLKRKIDSNKWRSVKVGTVKANNRYSFRARFSQPRRVKFRVVVKKNAELLAARSPIAKLRVTRAGAPTQPTPTTPPSPPTQPNPTNPLAAARATILRETNAFRAQQGLAPLKIMPELNQVAQRWSRHMATSGNFYHNPNLASEVPSGWSGIAENIAGGQQVAEVTDAWMASEGHRANILGPYNYIGIGVYADASGTNWYTQNFGSY